MEKECTQTYGTKWQQSNLANNWYDKNVFVEHNVGEFVRMNSFE